MCFPASRHAPCVDYDHLFCGIFGNQVMLPFKIISRCVFFTSILKYVNDEKIPRSSHYSPYFIVQKTYRIRPVVNSYTFSYPKPQTHQPSTWHNEVWISVMKHSLVLSEFDSPMFKCTNLICVSMKKKKQAFGNQVSGRLVYVVLFDVGTSTEADLLFRIVSPLVHMNILFIFADWSLKLAGTSISPNGACLSKIDTAPSPFHLICCTFRTRTKDLVHMNLQHLVFFCIFRRLTRVQSQISCAFLFCRCISQAFDAVDI